MGDSSVGSPAFWSISDAIQWIAYGERALTPDWHVERSKSLLHNAERGIGPTGGAQIKISDLACHSPTLHGEQLSRAQAELFDAAAREKISIFGRRDARSQPERIPVATFTFPLVVDDDDAIEIDADHAELSAMLGFRRWIDVRVDSAAVRSLTKALHGGGAELVAPSDVALPSRASSGDAPRQLHKTIARRRATPKDETDFQVWARALASTRDGVGPSLGETVKWAAARNIGREWAREIIKSLPKNIRQERGKVIESRRDLRFVQRKI